MADELRGKVAIITGGASGIGRASVARFLEEGARVVIADVNVEAGEAYARELGADATFHRTDVSQADDVERAVGFAVTHFGDLDIMFNNAGISGAMGHKSLLDEDFAEFDRVLHIDLLGVMLGTKFAARHMAAKSGGAIINTASTLGVHGGFGMICYRAAKAGVLNFTQAAAIELGAINIRVNAISPGPIQTPIIAGGIELPSEKAQALQRELMAVMTGGQALKRYGQAVDIANAAVFLASERAAHITGQNMLLGGGIGAGETTNRMALIAEIHERARGKESVVRAQVGQAPAAVRLGEDVDHLAADDVVVDGACPIDVAHRFA